MKKGIDTFTVILVALLLGILVMVGKVVNPISTKGEHDHDHGAEASTPPAQQPAAQRPPPQQSPPPSKGHPERPDVTRGPGSPKRPSMPPKGAMPAPEPDGMDPLLWQQHEMGTVTPKPDVKK